MKFVDHSAPTQLAPPLGGVTNVSTARLGSYQQPALDQLAALFSIASNDELERRHQNLSQMFENEKPEGRWSESNILEIVNALTH